MTGQGVQAWSPDGTRLLYFDDGKPYLTNATGGRPEAVDTGCRAPCIQDSQIRFSGDGRSIVFIRESNDLAGNYASAVATMDLASGRVAVLNPTIATGVGAPDWSPDGRNIVYFLYGDKDTNGPFPPTPSTVWTLDRDGGDPHQVSPTSLSAESARWSPDGTRIVFVTPVASSNPDISRGSFGDIFTARPDGSDIRRLTTDGISIGASWTPDGRILFIRSLGATPGWWTMNADGTRIELLVSGAALGVTAGALEYANPVWQPIGGAAIVPPPWTPAPGVAIGPPAATPSPTPIPALAAGFSWTGSPVVMNDGFLGETATLLADGRVLLAGGCGTSAQLYDPATGSFSPTGSLGQVRAGTTATLLSDGRVLFAGGYNCAPAGQDGIWASAELYDPSTGTFSPTGSLVAPRTQHTATLLADGRVLIAGGLSGSSPASANVITLASYRTAETDSFLTTAELYDPATGRFSRTGSMSSPHRGHTATLLQDGRVLVVGNGGESSPSSKAADLYDPATGKFSKAGSMKTGRWLHSATLLQDGRVLILGGRSPKDSVYTGAEAFDPVSGEFKSVGSMGDGRQQHAATLLPDGRVLITGGLWSDGQKWRVLSATEMFDPSTGTFSPKGSMGTPREGHAAILLGDGRVLIVAGSDIERNGGVSVPATVLYQP